MNTSTDVKAVVQATYGAAATRVAQGAGNACCGAAPASVGHSDPITADLYDALQSGAVPEKALLASLGCGNPTACLLYTSPSPRDRSRSRMPYSA